MTTFSELHARLAVSPDHERFTGAPIDIGTLTPGELGRLWPLLQAARMNPGTAPAVQEQAGDVLRQASQNALAPHLDAANLLATLRAVPQAPAPVAWLLAQAGHLATGPDPSFDAALQPLLPPHEEWPRHRHALLAIARTLGAGQLLGRLMDVVARHGGDTLSAREFAVLRDAWPPALLALAGSPYYDARNPDLDRRPDPAAMLADDAGYAAFARSALEAAALRIARIHAGELPYAADGAFDSEDAAVLGLAARVAATRDEPWYAEAILRLLPGACVAPGAARTAPSQALTIALGHAVEGMPTPEAVAALREALEVVRHAGLQKKLARHLKPAERALAQRPDVALRSLDAGLAPKQLGTLLAQCFEAGFVRPFELPHAQWRARLLGNAVAATFARTLVWRAPEGAFMLDEEDRPVDAQGRLLPIAGDAPVTLWHPVDADPVDVDDSGREAWRARIAQGRLRQPVRQAFREFYRPRDAGLFAGYALAVPRLLGVARREGWALDDDSLTRRFGDLRAHWCLAQRIHPGCEGVVASGAVVFARGSAPVALDQVPPRILSEACRAIDLLASVASVALEGDEDGAPGRGERLRRLAGQAGIDAMRRHAVAQVLRAQIAAGSVTLEAFHVQAGGARVSLRTGRVTRDGTPLDLALSPAAGKLRAVPWLPYDEALLERVIRSVGALLDAD